MYMPSQFREDRVPVLHDLIRRHPFATLTCWTADGFEASHLPMLIDPDPTPFGTLTGHLARPNPMFADGRDALSALAIFHGPQAYISPSWYPAKKVHGKVVPTWNYAVVHAHGTARCFEEPARLRALIDRLTDIHEQRFAEPWSTTDAPANFVDKLVTKGIVGVELQIDRLEGKWKLSQNRDAADRAGVVAGLRRSEREDDRAMAALMAAQEER